MSISIILRREMYYVMGNMTHQTPHSQEISKSMAMRNGFHNKAEIEQAMQCPWYNLKAIRIGTENVNVVSVQAEDLEEMEIFEPQIFWSPHGKCCECKISSARFRFKPSANLDGHYVYEAFDKELPFFDRMKGMDVVGFELIYDSDYWERINSLDDHSEHIWPKKFIHVAVPWISNDGKDVDNALQRTWIDNAGYFNMRWKSDCPI